jgi:hypothetical protein
MEKTRYLALVLMIISALGIGLIYAVSSNNCAVDSDCVLKDEPYCCGNETEYYKGCYYINETPREVTCLSTSPCADRTGAKSCKCEGNKCVGKQNESNPDCKNLYWIDNDNKDCGQKEFCGMYMYYGLQTFESREQCERAVNDTPECVTDDDCPQPNSEACIGVNCIGVISKCIDGKCKVQKDCPEGSSDEERKCMKTLSNGRKAEIKIMPETASQRAIERLGELGFNITLKEVGKGDDAEAIYEATAEKQGKILGLFKVKGKVSAQIDAETGEVTKVKKPWWAFMASGI